VVSGALALVLEACPELTYRDVKHLIAITSKKVDTSNSSWVTNSAGLSHSNDYGYGVIDPVRMVQECQSVSFTLLPPSSTLQVSQNVNATIPNNNSTGVTTSINITENKKVEWVGVTITSNHNYPGDLEISLISPSGTKSILLPGNNAVGDDRYGVMDLANGFRFSSVAFVDESSYGEWKVIVKDVSSDNDSNNYTLNSVKLEIIGY
jgi:subtilisin-like proprotein convertase family protein